MSMRILSTLTYYHPHWTGLTVLGRRFAEGLAERGHDVTVLASRHDPDLPRRERANGVTILRVPTLGRISRTVIMPSYPVALVREVARCDVVHLHTPMPEAALVAGVARLLGKPTLITHHGDVVMPAGALNAIIQRVMDAVIRLGMRLSDRVIVHTDDYRDHSAFLAPVADKIDSIYPPVVLPEPEPSEVERWRQRLGLEGRRLVGFAGRFVEEKGFDYLLEAVPLVRARIPNAQFLFAGDTNVAYERFFQRCRPLLDRSRDAVTEVGLLSDPQQMANFYALCDVFVLPSRSDCFAIVQVEALLAGTPLVTTDIPGAREVVRVTGAGTLVPPRDAPGLADGLVRVLHDPASYRPVAATVRDIFDAQRSVSQYEDLLLALRDGVTSSRRR
ncbi:MAG: glycosyltransferase family 4 protein [Actinomycetota bacterium]|nr:glycosyltransferase family 4 protein [Actinomycetota bacterium]